MPPSADRVTQVERVLETGDYTLDELIARTGQPKSVVYDAIVALRQAGVPVVKRYHLEREA